MYNMPNIISVLYFRILSYKIQHKSRIFCYHLILLSSVSINVIILKIRSSKDYFRRKTISSQNVRSEAQAKNFFFRREVMFHSQDIQVFVFLNIP